MEAVDKSWVTLKTVTFNSIYQICEEAYIHSVMIGLTTISGLGKSLTFKKFKIEHQNTYIIKLDKNIGIKDLYLEMLKALGVVDWTNFMRTKAMAEKFAFTIKKIDGPCLFIFDEAGLFSEAMLLYFQTIYDSTEGKLGIVLAGTPVLKANIAKWIAKGNNSGIAELNSRILYWRELLNCSKNERLQVAKANGVEDFHAKKISEDSISFRDVYNLVIDFRITQLSVHPRKRQIKITEPVDKSNKKLQTSEPL